MKVAGSLLILSRFSPQRESKWEKMEFRFEGLDSSFWSGFIWDLVHGRGQWRHPPSSQQHASAGISPIISKKPPAGIQYLVSLVNRRTCLVVCNCLVVCDLLLWLLNFQNSRHTLLDNIIWGRRITTPTVPQSMRTASSHTGVKNPEVKEGVVEWGSILYTIRSWRYHNSAHAVVPWVAIHRRQGSI